MGKRHSHLLVGRSRHFDFVAQLRGSFQSEFRPYATDDCRIGRGCNV